MPDYDFTRLSWRSFEQLIQSLAMAVMGPAISIFGDGPDGGREATFDGSIPYPSVAQSWSGYGVIQAKFRQRPSHTSADGQWAMEQLSRELAAFRNPESVRRIPDYYVFATSVALTPALEGGSLDKCNAILGTFSSDFGLKGYDIWDYNKLRALLDLHGDIRQAYSAWITPGDVLAQLVDKLTTSTPDFEVVIRNFLQKELLADHFVNLEQAGHSPENGIPLSRVFIDLPFTTEPAWHSDSRPVGLNRARENGDESGPELNLYLDSPWTGDEDGAAAQGFTALFLKEAALRCPVGSEEPPEPGVPKHRSPGRFVLVGGPGQGKTTIGQYTCQLFRAALLKNMSNLDPLVVDCLSAVVSQCSNALSPTHVVRRFPVRIVLNDFASYLARSAEKHPKSLLSYLAARIASRTTMAVDPTDLRTWLSAYPWCVVLDGLDEVPVSTNREAVLAAINDFWVDVSDAQGDVIVLATTRPQGYNDDFGPSRFTHYFLRSLEPSEALHYATRLVDSRWPTDDDRRARILSRLGRAAEDASSARLMKSPLQVTIMTTLVDRIGQPPSERWSLFHQYYNVIYQREMERDIPAAAILREHRNEIDAIHSYVGLALQVETERTGGTQARLARGRLQKLVNNWLEHEGYPQPRRDELTHQIIDSAKDRLVFLVEPQVGQFGFEIRSLQEFMAAEALMSAPEAQVTERLRSIAPLPNWRNVYLFAAGRVFVERPYLRDTVCQICAELDEVLDDPLVRRLRAGAELALDLLEDGPGRRQPRAFPILVREALLSLERPWPESHLRLARVFEPEVEGLYIAALGTVARRQVGLEGWITLLALAGERIPSILRLAEDAWPFDVESQAELLQYASLSDLDSFGRERLFELVPVVPFDKAGGLLQSDLLHQDRMSVEAKMDRICAPTSIRILAEFAAFMVAGGPLAAAPVRPIGGSAVPITMMFGSVSRPRQPMQWLQSEIMAPSEVDLSSLHPSWRAAWAAAAFAIDPTAERLGRALRSFANVALEDLAFMLHSLPWPLAAHVDVLDPSSSEVFAAAADAALSGHYGDVSDWRHCEAAWREGGVSIEGGNPVTPIEAVFLSSRLRLHIESSEDEQLASLFQVVIELPEPVRSSVAGMVVNSTMDGEFGSVLLEPWIQLIAYSSPRYLSIADLTRPDWPGQVPDRVLYLLNQIGKTVELVGPHRRYRTGAAFGKLLGDAIAFHPDRTGLLRIAAQLSVYERVKVPPQVLRVDRFSDPSDRAAALILLCNQGYFEEVSADDVDEIVATFDRYGSWMYALLRSLEGASSPAAVQILLSMSSMATTGTRVTIERVLRNKLSRRRSTLVTREGWNALGLLDSMFLKSD